MTNEKLRITADGSTTLYNEQLDEHYHSVYGAIIEALHVYINAGLSKLEVSQNSVLEVGFGTGLNAVLTAEFAEKFQKKIDYTTIEKYPLEIELARSLDFGSNRAEMLEFLHKLPWEEKNTIGSFFQITKKQEDFIIAELGVEEYDLVYFDAFAPDKQPEMWSEEVLAKVVEAMKKNAILVTYSTKGIVKQRFRNLGLSVKRLAGPPGKRDMLFVRKI